MTFSVNDDKEREMRETLVTVYNALKEKGYNPVSQIVGTVVLSTISLFLQEYGRICNPGAEMLEQHLAGLIHRQNQGQILRGNLDHLC